MRRVGLVLFVDYGRTRFFYDARNGKRLVLSEDVECAQKDKYLAKKETPRECQMAQ